MLSSAIGNNQSGESSFAFGSGAALGWAAAFGSEFVWASTSAGVVLILIKRASISRSVVLIEIAPLGISLRRRLADRARRAYNHPKTCAKHDVVRYPQAETRTSKENQLPTKFAEARQRVRTTSPPTVLRVGAMASISSHRPIGIRSPHSVRCLSPEMHFEGCRCQGVSALIVVGSPQARLSCVKFNYLFPEHGQMLWVVGFLIQDRSGCLPVHSLSINPWNSVKPGGIG